MTEKFIIRPCDIRKLEDCSANSSFRKLQSVREAEGKAPRKPVTIREYCNFFQLNESEVKTFLKENK